MLCIGISIGSLLQIVEGYRGYLKIIFISIAIISLAIAFVILKASKKISNGREIHISFGKKLR